MGAGPQRERVVMKMCLSELPDIAGIPGHVRALAALLRSRPAGRGPAAGPAARPQHARRARGKVLRCIAGMFSLFVWLDRLRESF